MMIAARNILSAFGVAATVDILSASPRRRLRTMARESAHVRGAEEQHCTTHHEQPEQRHGSSESQHRAQLQAEVPKESGEMCIHL
jgi:hypothetical protein